MQKTKHQHNDDVHTNIASSTLINQLTNLTNMTTKEQFGDAFTMQLQSAKYD